VASSLAIVAAACGGDGPAALWTEAQAASIVTVRGLAVRVRACEGLGEGRRTDAGVVFGSFSCLAGARTAGQPVDTVAVTYVLRPLGPYAGPSSPHELTEVRFGGLGVP
jgi:hypothetical protein